LILFIYNNFKISFILILLLLSLLLLLFIDLSTTLKPIFTYAISPSKESEKVQGTSGIFIFIIKKFFNNNLNLY